MNRTQFKYIDFLPANNGQPRVSDQIGRGHAVARRAVQPVERAAHRQARQPDEDIQAPRCQLLRRVSKSKNGSGLTGAGFIPRRVRGTGGGGFGKGNGKRNR